MFEEYFEKLNKNKAILVSGIVGLFVIILFLVFRPIQDNSTVDFPKSVDAVTVVPEKEEATELEKEVETPSFVHVDVKGAVKKEGIYQLPADARVNDAIEAAGGLTEQADKKSINLAQKLTDEAVIYVASQGENISVVTAPAVNTSVETGTGDATKINLNTASISELTTISGIGEKRANDIIAYRESNGGFKSIDDLGNVSGIGSKTLENIRPYVTVD